MITRITIQQFAERPATSDRHVRRLVAERRTPFITVGGLIRLGPADVDEGVIEHRTGESARAGWVG